jgi:hypothetical protein
MRKREFEKAEDNSCSCHKLASKRPFSIYSHSPCRFQHSGTPRTVTHVPHPKTVATGTSWTLTTERDGSKSAKPQCRTRQEAVTLSVAMKGPKSESYSNVV